MGLKESLAALSKTYGNEVVRVMGETDVKAIDVIPTGLASLDLALGCGGYPRGRIVELYGPESSGKSTLALMACAEAQKMGVLVAYIDAEHALDPALATIMGVDVDKLLFSQPECGEHCVEIIRSLVSSGDVGMIVMDSVAAMVPRAELEGESGDSAMGVHARLMSQATRVLIDPVAKTNTLLMFINQIRMKIGVMYGNPETTTGGLALKFASSIRIDVRRSTPIKEGDLVIGALTKCKVVKNKLAPPYRSVEFNLIYGQRPDAIEDLVAVAIAKQILTKAGAYVKLGDVTLGQGVEKTVANLKDSPEIIEKIKVAVKEAK